MASGDSITKRRHKASDAVVKNPQSKKLATIFAGLRRFLHSDASAARAFPAFLAPSTMAPRLLLEILASSPLLERPRRGKNPVGSFFICWGTFHTLFTFGA
jgi:hypothetical protein